MDEDKKFKCGKCNKAFKLKSISLLHSMKCGEKENNSVDEGIRNIKFQSQLNNDLQYFFRHIFSPLEYKSSFTFLLLTPQ